MIKTLYFVTDGTHNFVTTEKGLEAFKKEDYTQYYLDDDTPDPKSDEYNEDEFNQMYKVQKFCLDTENGSEDWVEV